MSDTRFTTEITEVTEERQSLNQLTELIIGAAIEVHRALGPGLLESSYEICLCRELSLRRIGFERQEAIPIQYRDVKLDRGYRADFVVADVVLVEIKAVDTLLAIHEAQLLSYMTLGNFGAGLLINFNERLLKHGIKRRLLGNDLPAISF